MEYKEEDFLLISGLRHFKFCRRRWALMYNESQWAENFLTIDGSLMHKNAHDKGLRESRGDMLITRGLSVFSATLGISGECDVVEFHRSDNGISLRGKDGLWQPYPIEYKRGTPRSKVEGSYQLCAQAMCLEEMLCCQIPEGALYFGETRQRQPILLTDELRQDVMQSLLEMHELYNKGHTPRVKPTKACNGCSLKEQCLPKLMTKRSVTEYLQSNMEDSL